MKKLMRVPAVLMLLSGGGCMQTDPVSTVQVYNPMDSYQQYVQRSDKVTLSAGNAQEVNTRIQEIDPWPRNVGNARIAVNGQRMADAVYRYRCGKRAPQPMPTETTTNTTGTSSGGSGAATEDALVRPGSDCADQPGGGKPAVATISNITSNTTSNSSMTTRTNP
jgi:hypothetical protein